MKVLVACEYSGIVRDAFTSAGHDAYSCDLIETTSPGQHIIGDALEVANSLKPDLMICHPPCRYLSKAGLHLCINNPERQEEQRKAVMFCIYLYHAPVKMIAMENPEGYLSSAFRPYDQRIEPWQFGDPYKKGVCLWLKNLPPLIHTAASTGRKSVNTHVNGRMNQETRSRIRARFFKGVAAAMAQQWGTLSLR